MSRRLASQINSNYVRCLAVLSLTIALGSIASKHVGAQPIVSAAEVQAQVPGTEVVRLDPALDAIIAPGTRIEKIATGFKFVEGPMWRQGRLWFSDLVGNKMYAVTPQGKVEMLMDHSGGLDSFAPGGYLGSNAMATAKDGSVLLIQQGSRRIVRLNKDMAKSPFLDKLGDKRLNSPNDLVYAPDGSLWFTDPTYGLPKQNNDPGKELSFNGVYRYANGKLSVVIKDMTMPNGIGFSTDGKTLYVSNSGPEMYVEKFTLDANGAVTGKSRLISYPGSAPDVPDGLKVDSKGNIWTSGPGGIRIITPAGKVIGQLKIPEIAANLAWGDDGKTAYITGSTSIYRLRLSIPGALPLYR